MSMRFPFVFMLRLVFVQWPTKEKETGSSEVIHCHGAITFGQLLRWNPRPGERYTMMLQALHLVFTSEMLGIQRRHDLSIMEKVLSPWDPGEDKHMICLKAEACIHFCVHVQLHVVLHWTFLCMRESSYIYFMILQKLRSLFKEESRFISETCCKRPAVVTIFWLPISSFWYSHCFPW